jgi:hypothetical protein
MAVAITPVPRVGARLSAAGGDADWLTNSNLALFIRHSDLR